MHRMIAGFALSILAGVLVSCASTEPTGGGTENPMADVGARHTQVLACLRSEDPEGRRDPFALMVDACGFDPGDETTMAELEGAFALLAPDLPDWMRWILSSPFNPYERGQPTQQQMDVLDEIGAILKGLDGADPDVPAAKADLADLETRAVETLGSEEVFDLAVLAGISVARSSLDYWSGVRLAGDAPLQVAADEPKWWQVVAADVAGGVVGGLFGGGVGAVGLGTAASKIVGDLGDEDEGGQANPGGNAGPEHNKYLACLDSEDPDGTEPPLTVLYDACGFDQELGDDTTREAFLDEYGRLLPNDPFSEWVEAWPSPFQGGTFEDEQLRFLIELGELIADLDDDSDTDRTLLALQLLEGRSVAALGHEPGDADLAVLRGMSIAVSSYSYWNDNSFLPPAAGKPKWWQVTLADVAGGVVGGVFGGGVGAVGLGAAASKAVSDLGGD